MHEIVAEIGARIRVVRVAFDLTREDVAAALEVSPRSIERYEDGSRQMSYEQLVRFIAATRVTADWVLFGFLDGLPSVLQSYLRQQVPELVRNRQSAFPKASADGPRSPGRRAAGSPAVRQRSNRP